MKKSKAIQVMGLALALVFTMGSGLVSAAEYCPDNFIFLVDQSGSMYMHAGSPQLKMAVSKKVLMGINDQIPSANYRGASFTAALELVAPVEELYRPRPFDRSVMADALKSIKDEQAVFDRLTPLGPGIISLDPVLAKMNGNTAVILVSDGMANLGADPVEEARAIYAKYPNTCIHIISVADPKDQEGREILTAINKLNSGSIMVDGMTLDSSREAVEEFVRGVFCTPRKDIPPKMVKEESMVLRGIHFDFDRYNIKSEWVGVLAEAARMMKERPDMKVMVEGHTDSKGSDAYNQRLSERRAQAVLNWLAENGVGSSRMQAIGYGGTRPIADNNNPNGSDNPEGRAMNRRVELKVVR